MTNYRKRGRSLSPTNHNISDMLTRHTLFMVCVPDNIHSNGSSLWGAASKQHRTTLPCWKFLHHTANINPVIKQKLSHIAG